jgi:hypothetical protein
MFRALFRCQNGDQNASGLRDREVLELDSKLTTSEGYEANDKPQIPAA